MVQDMRMDVYQTGLTDTYLLLPEGKPFSGVPQKVLDELISVQLWKRANVGEHLIGADPAAILADFNSKGYSVRSARVTIDVKIT